MMALSLAACAGGGSGPLPLSWQFADGRACAESGATTVTIKVEEETLGTFACRDGFVPQAVTVAAAPDSGTLTLIAASAPGNELYRGELPMDPAHLPVTVTLYATFAR